MYLVEIVDAGPDFVEVLPPEVGRVLLRVGAQLLKK